MTAAMDRAEALELLGHLHDAIWSASPQASPEGATRRCRSVSWRGDALQGAPDLIEVVVGQLGG